jgi:hypothetical protein
LVGQRKAYARYVRRPDRAMILPICDNMLLRKMQGRAPPNL